MQREEYLEQVPVVDDLMDRVFATVTPDTKIKEAIEILIVHKLTGLIVVDNEDPKKLVAVLSEKDCLNTLLQTGFHSMPDENVGSYVSTDVESIESGTDIITVAQRFLECTFRRFPVVRRGALVGQITRRDILRGVREFEEQKRR